MDVVLLLKEAIDALPPGDYSTGLTATLRHIQSAVRHFERDRVEEPDSFTDAIYRTNQAFEGSLKEAYRVLTGQDPSKLTTFEIERYLEEHSIVRPKVLVQLTRYRQDYRNPSTHDYKLDFDENEALLAILSVSAFAKLLVDQIAAKANFEEATREIAVNPVKTRVVTGVSPEDYFDSLSESLLQYMNKTSEAGKTERENAAHIAAFLASKNADVEIQPSIQTDLGWSVDWDIIVKAPGDERIAFDIKSSRGRQNSDITADRLGRLSEYLVGSKIRFGILVEGAARGEKYVIEESSIVNGVRMVRLGKKHR